jgi:general stress protein YciG
MTPTESGRKGGNATYRTYGLVRCAECGRLHDTGYMARIGAHGGAISGPAFIRKYGADYFSRIGKLGGRPRRQAAGAAVDSGEGALTSRPLRRSQ